MSTAAVGMTLAAPLKTAMDFEAQMSRVGAVSNSTKEQQVQLTAKAREMGRDTKFSALEAGQGMEYLAMAGFNANQQMAAIGGVLDVAAAAGTELGRTSDIVSNALTGFGLQADQAGRVGDVLTKTFTGSNTTLESLGETLKYVAPVASSAGASIELVAAMTGVLGDAGIQGSMAGTTLRNTFLRLIAPAKDAQKHMKQLGISAEQMREIMAAPEGQQAAHYIKKMGIDAADENGNLRDWMDILTELSVKMGNLSQADRLEAASSIFGKYAVSGGLALLDSLRHDEKYIEEQVKNMREQGATEEEIQKYRLETRNKLQDRYNKNLLASQQGFAKQVAARMLDNTKGEFATGLVTSSMRSSGFGTTPERLGTRSVHGRTRRGIMFLKNGRNSRVGAGLEMHPLERRTMENGRLLETSGCSVLPFLPRQAKTCLRSSVSGRAARQQGLPRLLHNPLRAQEM